jgi:hypothetical protein
MVIGIDCICSNKSNYHTIMITTTPSEAKHVLTVRHIATTQDSLVVPYVWICILYSPLMPINQNVVDLDFF